MLTKCLPVITLETTAKSTHASMVAMVAFANLALLILIIDLLRNGESIQVARIASFHQGVVLRGEVEDCELLPLRPKLVESSSVPSEPREGLFADGCVDPSNTLRQAAMHLRIANAFPIVFLPMPPVNDVVLDLLHLGVLLAIFLELAVPVHDECVAFLVQP